MFTCPKTVSSIFSFKEKTPEHLRSKIVYKIGCKDCESFYVGKTSRCFIRRLEEHKKGTGSEDYESALFKHEKSTGHTIDYDNATILDQASTDKKVLLKEMLYINKLRPNLNTQKKSELFSLIIGNT